MSNIAKLYIYTHILVQFVVTRLGCRRDEFYVMKCDYEQACQLNFDQPEKIYEQQIYSRDEISTIDQVYLLREISNYFT